MSVKIITCPGCESLLLSDTAQCPECLHVFDASRVVDAPSGSAELRNASMEDPCRECGVMVRVGSVRCWKCGTFMRKDIKKSYERKQSTPQKIIYSDIPANERTEFLKRRELTHDHPMPTGAAAILNAEDSDFDLATGEQQPVNDARPVEQITDADDAGFEVDPEFLLSDQGSSTDSNDTTFALRMPTDPPAAPSVTPAIESPFVELPEPDQSSTPTSSDAATEPAADSTAAADKSQPDESQPAASQTDDDSAAEADSAARPDHPESEVPHSIATSGDVLFDIARQEELEASKRRVARGQTGGKKGGNKKNILVACLACGTWIRVLERHAGKVGRCPNCKQTYRVPELEKKKSKKDEQVEGAVAEQQITFPWIQDASLHTVDPQKMKLKIGSLQASFAPVDLLFTPEGLHVLGLGKKKKKGGMFGKGGDADDDGRNPLREHMLQGMPLGDLPVDSNDLVAPSEVNEMKIVQPAPYAHESMFAGIAVFGENRIAVRLPNAVDSTDHRFLSFGLSGFRTFQRYLSETYGTADPPAEMGIPMTDEFGTAKCHYSDAELTYLEHPDYYLADADLHTTLLGYRCGTCNIVVSEDSRKKEKIGGKSGGKALVKAKCPKCNGPFGLNPLHGLERPPEPAEESGDADT